MSRQGEEEEVWGPSHQRMDPPYRRGPSLSSIAGGVVGWFFLLLILGVLRLMVGLGSSGPIAWLIGAVLILGLGRVALTLGVGALTRPTRTRTGPATLAPAQREPVAHIPISPATRAREGLLRVGGGAYLGVRDSQEWATADPETAAMILGPPGLVSYCTSAVSR